MQSADLATKQGTLADAKKLLQTVAELRTKRGDKKGAAEISVRLGMLDPEDLDVAPARRQGRRRTWATRRPRCASSATSPPGSRRKTRPPRRSRCGRRRSISIQSDEGVRAKLLAAYVAAGAPDKARKVVRGAVELKQLAQAYEKAGKHRRGPRDPGRGRGPRSV